MSKSTSAKSSSKLMPAQAAQGSPPAWQKWWQELRANLNIETIGLVSLLIGGGLLLHLWGRETGSLPWLVGMVGWTAPWVALAFLSLGCVLLLGEHAGFWSAEALVGAELLLLCLQAATFAWNNAVVTWRTPIDGKNGGLVGWALGTLVVAGLGQWPALVILWAGGAIGLVLLLRYTPLIYVVRAIVQLLPALERLWNRLAVGLPMLHPAPLPMIEPEISRRPRGNAASFVPPEMATVAEFVPPVDKSFNKPVAVKATPRTQRLSPVEAAPSPVGAPVTAPTAAVPKTTLPSPKRLRPAGELPPLDLLQASEEGGPVVDVRGLQQLIEQTLADFNVPVKVVHVESGPTVTQFGVEPLYLERAGQRRKVRVNRIVNLGNDLALALAAPAVRIEAPVPGRPYVGIEVPNLVKSRVTLRGIMESKVLAKEGGKLALPLGRNTAGQPVVMDMTRAPHMLIAGATGAGKSVCINTIVVGLLMQHGPESLRFIMVDPKMVELPGYNGIPHLLGKVITDVDQVMGALTWLLLQMDDRYRLFQQLGVRNIDAYTTLMHQQRPKAGKGESRLEPLPYIVLIIDELADLMMTAAEDIERQICRLAQMARATGIHLVLATQRPSIDVVTGLIKANFPTRVAFAVTSQIDSRVILDTPGAEALLGRGDMLLMRPDVAKLQRIQGCFVADEEITQVVGFWKAQAAGEETPVASPWAGLLDRLEDGDELVQDAMDLLRDLTAETVHTSLLQRKLRIGYPKAAQLMAQLEAKGFVGPDVGSGRGREVLLKDSETASG